MIVLENVSIAGSRKIDQRCSTRETHRHTEWELVRRSHVNDFGRALFRGARDRDSFPVNWARNDGCPGETKGTASLIESRIFDPRNLSPIYESHRADHHCLLRSGGNDDLVRMTTRTSVITQISCERLAQVRVATARCVLKQMGSLFCENFCSESFPYFDRKFVQRRDSGDESYTGRPSDSEIELFSDPVIRNISYPIGKARRALYVWSCFCRLRTQKSFGQRLGDECARSNSRLKITFRMKPLESDVHRDPRHS